jgi:O-antigen/teichoic acid export membrane protein
MVGQQRICAIAYAGAVVVNIAALLVLVPYLGPIGAAIATASAVVVESVLLVVAVKRRLGITMFIGRELFGRKLFGRN